MPITRWRTVDSPLGRLFWRLLGDKKGVRLVWHGIRPHKPGTGEAYVPMDECLARCVIDFSGRPYLVWRRIGRTRPARSPLDEKGRDQSPSAFRFDSPVNFFQAFANEAKCNLHFEPFHGGEPHHVVESSFKSFARR